MPPPDGYWIPRYFDAFIRGGSFEATQQKIFAGLIAGELESDKGPEDAEEAAKTPVGAGRGVWPAGGQGESTDNKKKPCRPGSRQG